MPVDYDVFRKQSWDERIAIFNAIAPEEKADLVRTHISRWLEEHRQELTDAQIAILEENIAFVTPELYAERPSEEPVARMKEIEARTAKVLSWEQMRAALTMHW